VNATIIYAEILGYPELWQLHNKTLEIYLAKPADNKYLKYTTIYTRTQYSAIGID